MAALFGDTRRGFPQGLREAVEIAGLQQHQPVRFVGQHVLGELRAERRQPGGNLGEALLLARVEPHARPHEAFVGQFQQALLLAP